MEKLRGGNHLYRKNNNAMNKKLTLIAAVLFTATFAFAQNTLEVTVKNIKSKTGKIQVALFDSEDHFLKTPFRGEIANITGETITIVFKDLPAGTYAASAIHDENGNGKLDRGDMGIPVEKYGFSRNAASTFGPPQFSDASFAVPDTKSISITVQ